MRAFKKFIGISITVLCFTLTSYSQNKPKATYQVGNSEMDADLSNINLNAKLDFGAFKTNLNLTYNISEKKIDYLSISVKMEPAEIYLALELTKLSGKSIDDVVEIYKVHKEKGWGYIAKQIGIKPGSPKFHKLKENVKIKESKGKGKSNKGKAKKK